MQKQAVPTLLQAAFTQRQAVFTEVVEERLTIWPPGAAVCLQPAPSGAAVPSQHSPADQPPFWSCLVPLQPSLDCWLQMHTHLSSCAWQPEPTAMTCSVRFMHSSYSITPSFLPSVMHSSIHLLVHPLTCLRTLFVNHSTDAIIHLLYSCLVVYLLVQ